jgi:dipeptidyl aminopeptidase/acylaminoacyl peptidase
VLVTALSLWAPASVTAQTTAPAPTAAATSVGAKRPLQIADYARWRSISGQSISPDGRWVAWSYGRVRGDDTLHVKAVDGPTTHQVAFATQPLFSDDGLWVAYSIGSSFADEMASEDDLPTQAGLLSLASGETWSWDNADDFGFAPGSSHFWVKKASTDDDAEHDGTDVILRHLASGTSELLGSVDELDFDPEGQWLAWTVDAADEAGNGLYLLSTDDGRRQVLDQASARYNRLTWAEQAPAVAVLRGSEDDGLEERENTLVTVTDLAAARPTVRAITPDAGLAEGWVLSEKGGLAFNDPATIVFVGTRPQADTPEEWPDSTLPLADVNIWHWADERIQAEQQRAATRDRNRTWLAAAHLADGQLVPIDEGKRVTNEVTPDGRWALTRDDGDYISDWKPSYADWSRVDTRTGERTSIVSGLERALGLSPLGTHWLYWRDGQMHAYDVTADRHVTLTTSAPISFVDAEHNNPGDPPPYGVGGFTADGRSVLLYGKHDIWLQPLDGAAATNLTGGWGAENDVRLRVETLDPDAETVDLGEPVAVRGFGLLSKQDGWFSLDGRRLEPRVFDDARFGRPLKAANADRILTSRQDWSTFPDLWVTDGAFDSWTRVTDANPQQSEFLWGRRVLFDYETADGIPLQGTLAIPETWQPGQKLPMIVRFYEQYSQDLHAYPTPIYRHQPNFAGYVSRGYLLMQPDIHFRTRTTHSDMLEAVEAATQAVIDLGYADPDAIGLSGHSFSGGGGAYIATRSTMFAAVAHGAAPINLVSEFNQLFVGSGQNNHSYDIYGQGRYGTNPYDDFDLYWDQSPISGVEQMNTPVLYLHGESDPTVNWEQGLEWYNALRFNGKPIIWLSYPDEGHGLSKLENRIDFQLRLEQFFGHHLRGEPAPRWMTDGVPYLAKPEHMREFAPGPMPWAGGRSGDGGGSR